MSTANMGLTLPVDHNSSNVWGPILETVFNTIDSHDHTVGKGVKVPTGGLNINADLSFSPSGTPRAITDLKAVDFTPVASSTVTSFAGAFFISDGTGGLTLNELYFRTTSGTNVKFTDGAALNVAAFAGGIGGDYTAVGAAVAYDDAADRYTFKQQSNLWARMASGEVRILETGTTEALYVGLAAPAALAASHTITLPLAAPGSTQIVQLDSAGVLTASNTVANAVTLSAGITNNVTLTLGATASGLITANAGITVATAQAVTLSGTTTLSVGGATTATGLITANAGVTAGANQHVTVSGTGKFKYGTLALSNPGSAFVRTNGTGAPEISGRFGLAGAAGSASMPIDLSVGARVTAVRVFIQDSGVGPTKLTASFRSVTSTGATTTIASSAESSGASTNQTLTISPAATTLVASTFYHVVILITTGTDSTIIWGCEVDYDQP